MFRTGFPAISKTTVSTHRRIPVSHTVEIHTEVRDAAAVTAACRRLGLPAPVHETAELFSGQATGLVVQLPDWEYPVVCDLSSGKVRYDNFAGRWGNQSELDHLLQIYAAEKVKIESRKRGNVCSEQQMPNGSIKLTIQVGGTA